MAGGGVDEEPVAQIVARDALRVLDPTHTALSDVALGDAVDTLLEITKDSVDIVRLVRSWPFFFILLVCLLRLLKLISFCHDDFILIKIVHWWLVSLLNRLINIWIAAHSWL